MTIQISAETARGGAGLSGREDCASATLVDLNGQMAMMAARLGATAYLLLRCDGIGGRFPGRPVAVMGGRDVERRFEPATVSRLSAAFSGHMERALTPLIMTDCAKTQRALAHMTSPFQPNAGLKAVLAGSQMVAFPIKLGGFGNGMAVFVADTLDLDSELLMALHIQTYRLAKVLLRHDMRRAAPRQNLNDRELECLQLAGEGLKSELIAERLTLSVHTVNAYLGTATAKLDSVNRIQAIAKAIRLGYLS